MLKKFMLFFRSLTITVTFFSHGFVFFGITLFLCKFLESESCVPISHYCYHCLFYLGNVTVLVTAKYSRKLIRNDYGWDGRAPCECPMRVEPDTALQPAPMANGTTVCACSMLKIESMAEVSIQASFRHTDAKGGRQKGIGRT